MFRIAALGILFGITTTFAVNSSYEGKTLSELKATLGTPQQLKKSAKGELIATFRNGEIITLVNGVVPYANDPAPKQPEPRPLASESARGTTFCDTGLGLVISFPSADGWSEVQKQSAAQGSTVWTCTNSSTGLVLSVFIIPAPSGSTHIEFKDAAKKWEKGFIKSAISFSPGKFEKLGGCDAYHMQARSAKANTDVVVDSWFMLKLPYSYMLGVTSPNKETNESDVAQKFIQSVQFKSESTIQP